MDERIKMTDEKIKNYFIREQKVIDYGYEFFEEICACSLSTADSYFINREVLPITCYNEMDEILASVDQGINYKVTGGFVRAGRKQAYIRIGIDTGNSILNKVLKRTIRHEIIHYTLWLIDLPWEDDSLPFWCLCHVFDGGAYAELSPEDEEYYELFKEIYDKHVKCLQWNVCHILIGVMIEYLRNTPIEEFADKVMEDIRNIKKVYRIED